MGEYLCPPVVNIEESFLYAHLIKHVTVKHFSKIDSLCAWPTFALGGFWVVFT